MDTLFVVLYRHMPTVESLMQEWPTEVEDLLKEVSPIFIVVDSYAVLYLFTICNIDICTCICESRLGCPLPTLNVTSTPILTHYSVRVYAE